MTPQEHCETALRLLELSAEQDDALAAVTAAQAQVHATLAGLPNLGLQDELLHQAELDLENARQRIRHLERLIEDNFADLIDTDNNPEGRP